MNSIRVTIRYPGASAEDVELFLTKPIEEKIKGLSGLYEVSSTSSFGSSSFSITMEPLVKNLSEKIQEIKDAVNSTVLPREAEDPVFRQFNSAEKAIMDVAIFHKSIEILSPEDRAELQKYALALKDRLLVLKEISAISPQGYLRPEIQIFVKPELLKKFDIPMAQVASAISEQHVRTPLGSMKDRHESEITILGELADIDSLKEVILRSGFQGQKITLAQVADIKHGFERVTSISKVQGREAIIFNIQKGASTDILAATKAVKTFIAEFKKNNQDSPIEVMLLDDESYDVRNRLSLVASNGLIGFILIVLVLFFFLDFRSGVWVAMGIPFSLAFTLIVALLLGYTINNMTLAAIIIVIGIVVDDAIIVAETIMRRQEKGEAEGISAVEGTFDVMKPVLASVLTTCAAFIPLMFFSGRFGLLIKYIPIIVFLMLLASLIESAFILPSHMARPLPGSKWWERTFPSLSKFSNIREVWIHKTEEFYKDILLKTLQFRSLLLLSFLGVLGLCMYLYLNKMSFVMFPREESSQVSVRVTGPENVTRLEMAKLVRQVENVFLEDQRGVLVGARSSIGQSRRGGEVRENEASLRVEITPPAERSIPLREILKIWEEKTASLEGFQEIRFIRDRFGSGSGSPIEIEIQENSDVLRAEVAERLQSALSQHPDLLNVEIETPVLRKEFKLNLKQEEVSRLNISFAQLASTLRAYVEGSILYTLNTGEEEVDVRLTSEDTAKANISDILDLRASNQSSYLVPIQNLVEVVEGWKPANIQRINFKRSLKVYADLKPGSKLTPLEIAEQLEQEVFPQVVKGAPSTNLQFRGEVEDSRESQSDFSTSLTLVLVLIFVLLVFLFNSVTTPFLIGAIIPFGVSGVILAFWAHGMERYGFFSVIGTLGMIGVVINDSIVMLTRFEEHNFFKEGSFADRLQRIAEISATRLRPVIVTTLTTVAGLLPTAYGIGGYDSMLAEMMLAMAWGLMFATLITLFLLPCIYSFYAVSFFKSRGENP